MLTPPSSISGFSWEKLQDIFREFTVQPDFVFIDVDRDATLDKVGVDSLALLEIQTAIEDEMFPELVVEDAFWDGAKTLGDFEKLLNILAQRKKDLRADSCESSVIEKDNT